MRKRELINARRSTKRLIEAIKTLRESLEPDERSKNDELSELYGRLDRPIRILVEVYYKTGERKV
jgi:hypothetical protein